MVFAMILVTVVSSYVALGYRALDESTRAFGVDESRNYAEVGLEEALWALNRFYNDGNSDAWDGWNKSNTEAVLEKNSLGPGGRGSVLVRIEDLDKLEPEELANDANPPITVTVEARARYGGQREASREVQAEVRRMPLFDKAMAAAGSDRGGYIYFPRRGTIESYHSEDSGASAFEAYIAAGQIWLNRMVVNGYVATSPDSNGVPRIVYTSYSRLKGENTPSGEDIDWNRVSTRYAAFPFQIEAPGGAGQPLGPLATPANPTVGTAGAATPTVYRGADLVRTSGKVTVQGPIRIILTGRFEMTGTAHFDLLDNGSAAMEIYAAGRIQVEGIGINNFSKDPRRLIIVGTGDDSQRVDLNGLNWNQPFYGLMYAPNATLIGVNDIDLFGSFAMRIFYFTWGLFTGDVNLQYDLNLKDFVIKGSRTPFTIQRWMEL